MDLETISLTEGGKQIPVAISITFKDRGEISTKIFTLNKGLSLPVDITQSILEKLSIQMFKEYFEFIEEHGSSLCFVHKHPW